MITVIGNARRAPDVGGVPPSGSRLPARAAVVALLCWYAAGCGTPVLEANPQVTEGEAILAALEHVAEPKWGRSGTIMVRGQAAVKHGGEEPLSDATRVFLDKALEARGWRWSTEDPLVPTGDCAFPGGDCRLKNPTEVHLTFSVWPWPGDEDYTEARPGSLSLDRFHVEPVPGEQGYKVHVEWLSSYHSSRFNGPQATLGGTGVLVTRGTDGLVVRGVTLWVT